MKAGYMRTALYTLQKFWWYNKASLGELVLLEILGKFERLKDVLLYLLDSSSEVCKGLTKCWNSKNHLVVSSEFWKSVQACTILVPFFLSEGKICTELLQLSHKKNNFKANHFF